jgi:putative folate metabolism gamma-glutamate ligase
VNITSIKTHKITGKDTNLFNIIDTYINTLEEKSILVVTSKIVAICEGNTVDIGSVDKDELVIGQADKYLSKETNSFGLLITIKNNVLAVNAGIDESNANGQYVLWPKNAQESANKIRKHLQEKFGLRNVGVVITDSKTTPLRWGITGIGLAYSGFEALNNFIGSPDIFGRPLKITTVNIMDGIAAAAAVVMGEAAEQTPLAVVTDVPFVEFQDHDPTEEDLNLLNIDPKTDIYGAILKSAPWKKGKNS